MNVGVLEHKCKPTGRQFGGRNGEKEHVIIIFDLLEQGRIEHSLHSCIARLCVKNADDSLFLCNQNW